MNQRFDIETATEWWSHGNRGHFNQEHYEKVVKTKRLIQWREAHMKLAKAFGERFNEINIEHLEVYSSPIPSTQFLIGGVSHEVIVPTDEEVSTFIGKITSATSKAVKKLGLDTCFKCKCELNDGKNLYQSHFYCSKCHDQLFAPCEIVGISPQVSHEPEHGLCYSCGKILPIERLHGWSNNTLICLDCLPF